MAKRRNMTKDDEEDLRDWDGTKSKMAGPIKIPPAI